MSDDPTGVGSAADSVADRTNGPIWTRDGVFGRPQRRALNYYDLPTLMGYMIKAAARADLEHQHIIFEDGAYRFSNTFAQGRYRSGDSVPDDLGIIQENELEDLKAAVEGTFDKWAEKINSAFEAWMDLPDPSWFADDATRVAAAMSRLTIAVQYGEGDGGVSANAELAQAISNVESRTGELRGEAIEVFHENYATKIGPVVSNFGASIYPLALGLRGEQEIWSRTRTNLIELADEARHAFHGSGPKGASVDDVKTALAIAGAVLSVAAIPLTGGASIAAASAAAAIGVSSTALDLLPEQKSEPAPLGGSHPDVVYDNLLAALRGLNRQIYEEEQGIRGTINTWLDNITGANAGRITIERPRLVDATDSNQVLADRSVKMDGGIIKRIVTDHIPEVTAPLTSTSGELFTSQARWQRDAWLGLGTYGPWADYEFLRTVLVPQMQDVVAELERAATILWEAYVLIRDADDGADNDLRKVQKRLGALDPEPVVPQP